MGYQCHNFCNGQTLDAKALNDMEQGIVNLEKKATITGKGAPTVAIVGEVGGLYVDEDTGKMYKCTAAISGEYTWEPFGSRGETIDDAIMSNAPWSSKNTVDKLCPSFTETGTIVTCEPVEGYPLEVVSHGGWEKVASLKGKDPGGSGETYAQYEAEAGMTYKVDVVSAGTLTDVFVKTDSVESIELTSCVIDDITASISFISPVDGKIILDVSNGSANVTYTVYKLAPATKIFRTGKNLVNSNVLDANNEKWDNYTSGRYRYYLNLAPGTYTASVKRIGTATEYLYLVSNFGNGYLEENMNVISGSTKLILGSGSERTCTFNVRSGEIVALYTTNRNVSSFVEWIQVEAGSVKTDYEQYEGDEFDLGQEVPALQGVNSIWADVGEITVTGRKDPVAIIDKLTNAILSLGGNV